MKPIADQCKTFSTFLRDIIILQKTGFVKYYKPEYEDYLKADQEFGVNQTLTEATVKD
jgi:asparagine synthase (glutamine-hydrolysing)